jgi:tetratricopeptide (TPR) repeat protein
MVATRNYQEQVNVQGEEPGHHSVRKSKVVGHANKSGLPVWFGVLFALLILLISAGATIFFLTKPPEQNRLYEQGQKELANGQYAFAVKSLEQALALHPDARTYLSLARAYVGVEQIEKAWQCVSQAQQLGQGVATEPALASELANYYRQHQQWSRAAELLRPLAQAGVPGKKAELADLDGLWGDECIRTNDLNQALKCWEEVRSIGEGTRTTEVDSRLATIYQRYANNLLSTNDDTKALDYLTKLNVLAPTAANYEKVAEIYERQGQLELAIDQLRKAAKLDARDPLLDKHLAALMVKRGKELLDKGDSQAGFGYLQEARNYDTKIEVPSVVLRNVILSLSPVTHNPALSGEIWNPGPNPILSLSAKVELFDTAASRVIWNMDKKVIDEFEPPLVASQSKPFTVSAMVPVRENGTTEFRVYFAGNLYKTYPIGQKQQAGTKTADESKPGTTPPVQSDGSPPFNSESNKMPPVAPNVVPQETSPAAPPPVAPQVTAPPAGKSPYRAPEPGQQSQPPQPGQPAQPGGAEDKTLKDLEL